VGPQHPKDVARDAARDLTGIVGKLATLKADASQLLTGPEYEALRLRSVTGGPQTATKRRPLWRRVFGG
jgi:hypothetical protein